MRSRISVFVSAAIVTAAVVTFAWAQASQPVRLPENPPDQPPDSPVKTPVIVGGQGGTHSMPTTTRATSRAAHKPAMHATTLSATSKATSAPAGAAKHKAPANQIAHIRLAGHVMEGPPDVSLFGESGSYMTLADWLQRLAKARTDDAVLAVALEIDSPTINWAQASELADAVRRLAASKPVYAYLVSGDASEYVVASAAKHVAMDPAGELSVIGLGAEMMFFRGTLDKLGIKPQMIQIGKYKGASEPMSLTEPSAEVKEMYNALLDDLYDQYAGTIAKNRNLKTETVKAAIDHAPLTAADAKKAGLIDQLVAKIDWEDWMEKKAAPDERQDVEWVRRYGHKPSRQVDFSNPFAMLNVLLKGKGEEEIKDPTIAVIYADGVIADGESGDGLLGDRIVGAKTLVDAFEGARQDDRIKAVIFRIASPGGSAIASELIYQAVKRCAEEKPVIACISDVGASGGYYIASGADTIIADPSAIVGSIGVVSGKFAVDGLFQKLGITTYEFTRGKNAGLNMSRAWTQEEEGIMRKLSERTYELFVSRVAESRGKKIKNVDDVAQGRIFTARQAVANGLIDKVGGLRDAVIAAQKAADIEESHFIYLPQPKTLIDLFSGGDEDARSLSGPKAQAGRRMVSISQLSMLLGDTDSQVAQAAAQALGKAGKSGGYAAIGYLLNIATLMERETTLTAMPYYLQIRR